MDEAAAVECAPRAIPSGAPGLDAAAEPRASELTDELAQLEAELREMESRLGVQVPDSPVQSASPKSPEAQAAVTPGKGQSTVGLECDMVEEEDATDLAHIGAREEEEQDLHAADVSDSAADFDLAIDPDLEALLRRYREPPASSASPVSKTTETTSGLAALAMLGEREAELEREVRQLQLELAGGSQGDDSADKVRRPVQTLQTIEEEPADATWDYTPQGLSAPDLGWQKDCEDEMQAGLEDNTPALTLDLATLSQGTEECCALTAAHTFAQAEESSPPGTAHSVQESLDEIMQRSCGDGSALVHDMCGDAVEKLCAAPGIDDDAENEVSIAKDEAGLTWQPSLKEESTEESTDAEEEASVASDQDHTSPVPTHFFIGDEMDQDSAVTAGPEADCISGEVGQPVLQCPQEFATFSGLKCPPPLPPLPSESLSPRLMSESAQTIDRVGCDAQDSDMHRTSQPEEDCTPEESVHDDLTCCSGQDMQQSRFAGDPERESPLRDLRQLELQDTDLDTWDTEDSAAGQEEPRISPGRGISDTLDSEECAAHLASDPMHNGYPDTLDADPMHNGYPDTLDAEDSEVLVEPAAAQHGTSHTEGDEECAESRDVEECPTAPELLPAELFSHEEGRFSLELAEKGVLDTLDIDVVAASLSPHPVQDVVFDAMDEEEQATVTGPEEACLSANRGSDVSSTEEHVAVAMPLETHLSGDVVLHGMDAGEHAIAAGPEAAHPSPDGVSDVLGTEECAAVVMPFNTKLSRDVVLNGMDVQEYATAAGPEEARTSPAGLSDVWGTEECAAVAMSPATHFSRDLVPRGVSDISNVREYPGAAAQEAHQSPNPGLDALSTEDFTIASHQESRLSLDLVQQGVLDTLDIDEVAASLSPHSVPDLVLDAMDAEGHVIVAGPEEARLSPDGAYDVLGTGKCAAVEIPLETDFARDLAQHGISDTCNVRECAIAASAEETHLSPSPCLDMLDVEKCSVAADSQASSPSPNFAQHGIFETGNVEDCSELETCCLSKEFAQHRLRSRDVEESAVAVQPELQLVLQSAPCVDTGTQECEEAWCNSQARGSTDESVTLLKSCPQGEEMTDVELLFPLPSQVLRNAPVEASVLCVSAPSIHWVDCGADSPVSDLAHGDLQPNAKDGTLSNSEIGSQSCFGENESVPVNVCDDYVTCNDEDVAGRPMSMAQAPGDNARLKAPYNVQTATSEKTIGGMNSLISAYSLPHAAMEEFGIELNGQTSGATSSAVCASAATCCACGTANMPDSRFCRMCGQKCELSGVSVVKDSASEVQPFEIGSQSDRECRSEKRLEGTSSLGHSEAQIQKLVPSSTLSPERSRRIIPEVRPQHQRGGEFLKHVFALDDEVEEPSTLKTAILQASPAEASCSSVSHKAMLEPVVTSGDAMPRDAKRLQEFAIFSCEPPPRDAEHLEVDVEADLEADLEPDESPVHEVRGLYGNIRQQFEEQHRLNKLKKREKRERQERLKREEQLKREERLARLGMAPPVHTVGKKERSPVGSVRPSLGRSTADPHIRESKSEKHGSAKQGTASAPSLKLPPLVGNARTGAMDVVEEGQVSFQGVKVKLPAMSQHTSKPDRSAEPPKRSLHQGRGASSSSSAPSLSLRNGGRSSKSSTSRPTLESIEKQKTRLANKMELLSVFHTYHNKVENMSVDQMQSLLKQLHGKGDTEDSPTDGVQVNRRLRQIDRVCSGIF